MDIAPGVRLGPYEVVAAIGAGGMGEVYRANDTRLDRIVALKILPSHLSSNAQFRERFDREARTISSLTHPRLTKGPLGQAAQRKALAPAKRTRGHGQLPSVESGGTGS